MSFIAKILINKKTNQFSIALSKKKIEFLKKNIPKFIKIKDFEFLDEE